MTTTQKHLLAVRDLTFDGAKTKCIADEMAGKANREHMGKSAAKVEEINKVQQEIKNDPKCECCGYNHTFEKCRLKHLFCNACNQKVHLQRVCPSANSRGNRWQGRGRGRDKPYRGSYSNQYISEEPMVDQHVKDEEEYGFGMYNVRANGKKCEPYIISVKVGGKNIDMQLDTGASRSTISEYNYNMLFPEYNLRDCDFCLRS
jgi:hypothetical protein